MRIHPAKLASEPWPAGSSSLQGLMPTSLKAVSALNRDQWKWSTYIMVSHLNIFADPGLISAKGTSWKLRFATLPVTEISKGPKLSSFIWKWPCVQQQLLFWANVHIYTWFPGKQLQEHWNMERFFAVSGVFIRESVHKYSLKKNPNNNNNKNKESVNLGQKHPGQNRK